MSDDNQSRAGECPGGDSTGDRSTNSDYGSEVDNQERLSRAVVTALEYRQWMFQPVSAQGDDGITGDDDSTELAKLNGLAGKIIDAAAPCAGKYHNSTSLSTQILNTVGVGLNAYVYDRVVQQGRDTDDEEAALLIAGLVLQNAGEYIGGTYGVADLDGTENSETVLDQYFSYGDDFGLLPFLREHTETKQEVDVTRVKRLMQRVLAGESSSEFQGQPTCRIDELQKYCRIGDGVVSKASQANLNSAATWLESAFDGGGDHIHHLQFTAIEQSLLHNHLLASVTEIIESHSSSSVKSPAYGVILGSTPDGILYLGQHIDRAALRKAVTDGLMQRVTRRHEFNAKTEWNSFEYDVLEEIDIPFQTKREIIAAGYAETLRNGSGTEYEFESISAGYKAVLPELARTTFREQNYDEAFEDYPTLYRLWTDVSTGDKYSAYSQKIGFLAELFRRYRGSAEDGYDSEQVRREVSDFASAQRDSLKEELEPKSEAGEVVTQRFFQAGLQSDMEIPASDGMCFLCGRPAARQYKKGGDAFYKTQSFSRRVAAEGWYKRICSACNLEHALLRDLIESTGYSVGSDIKIAFVYYDEFVGNLTIGTEGNSRTLMQFLTASEDDDELPESGDQSLVASSFAPQYHLHPFYASSENDRLRAVSELLETVVSRGFKVVVGKPFAGFNPQDALLSDLTPTRRQTAIGAERIESFPELERVQRLFTILEQIADSTDYTGGRELTSIQRDGFQHIAALVAKESEWFASARDLAHRHFIDSGFGETHQYMMMREVAYEGLSVYGQQYNSKYNKTKIFRLAVDAILDGLNRGKKDNELKEHVSGQVYRSAIEEKYAGRVTTDKVSVFVNKLFEFLREDGSLDKQTLNSRRDTLTNTYLFAYDRLLNELQQEDGEPGLTSETTRDD